LIVLYSETLGDVALQLPAQYTLGLSHFYQGSYDQALDCFRFVTSTYGDDMSTGYYAAGGASLLTFAHAALNLPHAECGTFTEGLRHSREASRLADMADNLYSRILGHTFVGFLYLRKGALDEAISILESGLELCRSGNIPRFVPDIACWLGNALTLSDRLSEAVPILEDAVQQGDAMRFMVGQALRVSEVGYGCGSVGGLMVRGDRDEMKRAAALAIDGNVHAMYQQAKVIEPVAGFRTALHRVFSFGPT
jgi:tetratricopeptide (TPR) repeat protein